MKVVETGVARGVTTRVILEGLELNGAGHLWSIDLPPTREPWARQVGAAVPSLLRHRWTYVRGSSRRTLPGLLEQHSPVGMFVHDSLHTHRNLKFELRAGWDALQAGGVMLADDIGLNPAFDEFVRTNPGGSALVCGKERTGGFFGIVRRAGVDPAADAP